MIKVGLEIFSVCLPLHDELQKRIPIGSTANWSSIGNRSIKINRFGSGSTEISSKASFDVSGRNFRPKEISDDEYRSFYRAFTKTNDEPLIYSHFLMEGEVTFRSILYVPKVASSHLFPRRSKTIRPIKLYIRRVFVTDHFEEILPKYLSFIRGIVDTDDLSLEVSRESVQQSKHLESIKKSLIRKALDMFKRISEKDFPTFWKEYGTSLKLGAMEDTNHRERLVTLLRFYTSFSRGKLVLLIDYVQRMKFTQEYIYYTTARTVEEAEKVKIRSDLPLRSTDDGSVSFH